MWIGFEAKMKNSVERVPSKRVPPFAAWIPFSTPLISHLETIMPLSWAILATVLSSISLIAIYTNIAANDIFWASMGIWAYIVVGITVYTAIIKRRNATNAIQPKPDFSFPNLFKTCANAVFSDYRISLLSKIPLSLQVIAGGTLLYYITGADWIMHALAGFGIGAMALKAYTAGVGTYSYERLASYFRIDKYNSYKTERRFALAEFTVFSILVFSVPWETFERVVHYLNPDNIFRVGAEPLWNIAGDMISAILGGMLALYLLKTKLKWITHK